MERKVIFHVDEMRKWELLLSNAANLLKSGGDSPPAFQLEVLANSEAVRGYLRQGGASAPLMEDLAAGGVRFVACGHALRAMGIAGEQLFPFVDTVPAGVRELVDRQLDGYAYIKP